MNPAAISRRLAGALAGAAGAVLAPSAATPPSPAARRPTAGRGGCLPSAATATRGGASTRRVGMSPGRSKVPVRIPGRTVADGGMPAWQITLLAAAAAA